MRDIKCRKLPTVRLDFANRDVKTSRVGLSAKYTVNQYTRSLYQSVLGC